MLNEYSAKKSFLKCVRKQQFSTGPIGFPIAAIGAKKEIMGELGFQKIAHGGTYTGNVVATAAACATLDEIVAGAFEDALNEVISK